MNRMKKLLLAILICGLVSAGAGLVVGVEGNAELLGGPLGDLVDRATSLVERSLPWAHSMDLEIKEVVGEAGDKHAVAEGVIQGENGQQMDIFLDAYHEEGVASEIMAIGTRGSVQIGRSSGEQESTLITGVQSEAEGESNATDIITLWEDNAQVMGTTSVQAGNTIITGRYEVRGSGTLEQITSSSDQIRIQSQMEMIP